MFAGRLDRRELLATRCGNRACGCGVFFMPLILAGDASCRSLNGTDRRTRPARLR